MVVVGEVLQEAGAVPAIEDVEEDEVEAEGASEEEEVLVPEVEILTLHDLVHHSEEEDDSGLVQCHSRTLAQKGSKLCLSAVPFETSKLMSHALMVATRSSVIRSCLNSPCVVNECKQ